MIEIGRAQGHKLLSRLFDTQVRWALYPQQHRCSSEKYSCSAVGVTVMTIAGTVYALEVDGTAGIAHHVHEEKGDVQIWH